MVGSLISVALRVLQIRRLLEHPKVQELVDRAKAWYGASPAWTRAVVGLLTLGILAVAFFA